MTLRLFLPLLCCRRKLSFHGGWIRHLSGFNGGITRPAGLSLWLSMIVSVRQMRPPPLDTWEKHTPLVRSLLKQVSFNYIRQELNIGWDKEWKAWDGSRRSKEQGSVILYHISGGWEEVGLGWVVLSHLSVEVITREESPNLS